MRADRLALLEHPLRSVRNRSGIRATLVIFSFVRCVFRGAVQCCVVLWRVKRRLTCGNRGGWFSGRRHAARKSFGPLRLFSSPSNASHGQRSIARIGSPPLLMAAEVDSWAEAKVAEEGRAASGMR